MILRPRHIPSILPETQAFAALIKASASTIKMESLQAIDRFVRDCYNAGIWTKLIEVYPFCGDDLTAAMVKLKNYFAAPALTAVNLVAGDYTERGPNGGIAGNGTTKYIDTNFLQSNMGLTAHYSAYIREAEATGLKFWIGANTATDFSTLGVFNAVLTPYSIHGGNTVSAQDPANATPAFYATDRSAANRLDIYKNGVSAANATTVTAAAFGAINMFALARNNNGAAASWSAKKLSFFSIGASLTAAEHVALYNAVQNLQTNLQRNV